MASLAHHNSGILIPHDEYEELTEALATVFRIGARFTPRLIERLDLTDGDPDDETDDPDLEPIGDEADGAWIEWNTMRGSQKRGPNILPTYNEDDEDDDPREANGDETDGDFAEDEFAARFRISPGGPGCVISDPDEGVDDKGEMDDEREPDEVDSPQPIIGGGSGDYPGGDAA